MSQSGTPRPANGATQRRSSEAFGGRCKICVTGVEIIMQKLTAVWCHTGTISPSLSRSIWWCKIYRSPDRASGRDNVCTKVAQSLSLCYSCHSEGVFVLLMTNLLSLVELLANGVVKNGSPVFKISTHLDCMCVFLVPITRALTTFRWNRIICQLSHSEVFPHSETRVSPRATSEGIAENN